jgi:hypothetical protein
MLRPFTLLLLCGLLALPHFVLALNRPASDPQALTLASLSVAALTGGTAVTDITLTGNSTLTIGSDVGSGPAKLSAKGRYESRLDLNLDNGQRTEIRNSTGGPLAEWIGADGSSHLFALANCMTDAVWFYPTFSSLASANDPNQTLSYIGLETLNGASVQHLHSVWSGQDFTSSDFYLDATTLLPVATSFNAHPDDDPTKNIAVQVLFSTYENLSGVQVPYHIQELFNGVLLLDFTATTAAVNSGLQDSLFAIQ